MHHHLQHPTSPHLLSALDPRVKLLSALALLAMVLTAPLPLFPLLIASACLCTSLLLGVSPRLLLLRLAQPLFIAAVLLLLKLFSGSGEPLFTLHLGGIQLAGYREGMLAGMQLACRILGAVSVVGLLFFSTSFTELIAALSWLRLPPALAETALLACRYLFLLLEDARTVYAAQKNRLGYAGYRRGVRSLGTLAGVLVIKAFDSSQSMSAAMVQRGYDGRMPMLEQRPLARRDLAAATVVVALAGVLWRM